MRPSHRLDAAALALLLALAASPALAFQVHRHSNLSSEVLSRQGVAGPALSLIRQGVRWPDMNQCLDGCYCPAFIQTILLCDPPDSTAVRGFSVSHFDNNMLDQSRAHVESLMQQARDALATSFVPIDEDRRRLGVGMMLFGRALHAIQDFYAHSTWIDMNRDLIRIGGRIESCPLWNGEQLGGTVVVGGATISGTQTGFVELPTPAGSTTHDALNKDAPGTAQGALTITRIFPATVIGTKYEIASGQVGGNVAPYLDTGLAPRHTIKAWQCLQSGCAIYNLPEGPAGSARAPLPLRGVNAQDFAAALAFINSDAGMAAAAARMDSVWEAADIDTPSTYPIGLFDADGWPLPATTSVEDLVRPTVRLLSGATPNPFRQHSAIRFFAPRAGHVRLELFDATGRRRSVLFDREVTPGWKDLLWNGCDGNGARVEPGTYLCRLRGLGHDESVRMTLVD